MKKFSVAFLVLFLFPAVIFSADFGPYTTLTGDGGLASIDGNSITVDDTAVVHLPGKTSNLYICKADGANAIYEHEPMIIIPDTNAGVKRWHLWKMYVNGQLVYTETNLDWSGFTLAYASDNGCALDSNVSTGGGTDDTTALQALLDTAPVSGMLHIIVDGPIRIGQISVSSNTILEFTDGFFLNANTRNVAIRNKNYIGVNGSTGYGTDENIYIMGGFFNGNAANQGYFDPYLYDQNGLLHFGGITNLVWCDFTVHDAIYWGAAANNVSRLAILNCDRTCSDYGTGGRDGFDVLGPAEYIVMNDLTISTGDDGIAFASDNFKSPYTGGPTRHVSIANINFNSSQRGIAIYSINEVFDDVDINYLRGSLFTYTLNLSKYVGDGPGSIGTVSMDDVIISDTSTPSMLDGFYYRIGVAGNVGKLNISNTIFIPDIRYRTTLKGNGFTASELNINNLSLPDSSLSGGASDVALYLPASDEINIINSDWTRSSGYTAPSTDSTYLGSFIVTSGNVTTINLLNLYANKCVNLFKQYAGTLGTLNVADSTLSDSNFYLYRKEVNSATTFNYSNLTYPDGQLTGGTYAGQISTGTYTSAPPTAGFSAGAEDENLAVALTDTSTGSPKFWAWDFGDGTTSSRQNPTHLYAVAGTYTVSLTTDNGFGSDTSSQSVIIEETGDTTDPACTITTPAASPYDNGTSTSITVSGTASDDTGVTSVTWSNSLGGSGTCTGTTSWTADITGLSVGDNVITITARDAADNTGTDTVTVGVSAVTSSVITSGFGMTGAGTNVPVSGGGCMSDSVDSSPGLYETYDANMAIPAAYARGQEFQVSESGKLSAIEVYIGYCSGGPEALTMRWGTGSDLSTYEAETTGSPTGTGWYKFTFSTKRCCGKHHLHLGSPGR